MVSSVDVGVVSDDERSFEELEGIASRINRLSGADLEFERLVSHTLEEIRQSMGVPARTSGTVDLQVEREFDAARARLQQFRAEFQKLQAHLLIRHVGREYMAEVEAALDADGARRFFSAQNDMAQERAGALRAFLHKMTDTVLFESSAP